MVRSGGLLRYSDRMNERRTGDAAVTGVAKGALGTGTALDETQEWVVPADLQARPEPPAAAAPAEPAATLARAGPVAAVNARPVVAKPLRHQTPAAAPSILGSPRTAGIAAAVLLALIAVTAVVTSFDDSDAGAAPVAPAQVTTAPTEAPPAEAGGNGGDNGGGKKDKGKGPGNDNGNGGGRGNN